MLTATVQISNKHQNNAFGIVVVEHESTSVEMTGKRVRRLSITRAVQRITDEGVSVLETFLCKFLKKILKKMFFYKLFESKTVFIITIFQ